MQMMRKRTNCYIYTRVSTSMQVDGYSLDAQREKLRGYAAYQEMTVVGEYSDEGFSGKNIQGRMEFRRMLEDIQAQKDSVDYVLVFKLSRFGRNAADVLNSLQLMQDYGVNLICVEDGIDSSKESGKLMISVLSAVAEIERENIRAQTMAGREQKAREGKWNGGFAPYGYKLENGLILIAEDEAEVIRIIYDRYVHTSDRISTIAEYLNRNGYTKKLRQNNMLPTFSADFIKAVLDNPIYCGKIAYGRRKTVKRVGTRNETHIVWADDYPVHDGLHEAIVSEEVWQLAQKKRKNTCFAKEKLKDSDHAHILSGILRCPCCGKGLYGNVARGKTKDNKIRYYYYCKNPVKATGHSCGFRFNLEQSKIDTLVASIISAMVNRPEFVEAIREKLGTAVDTSTIEKQIDTLKNSLRLASGIKSHLERQMDAMNPDDPFFDQKIADLQRRYDFQYERMAEITEELDAANDQLQAMLQEKLTTDSIYQLLLVFDQLYGSFTEIEKKKFMQAFIEKIELYPEKQPDGNWLKHITFNFPIPTKGGQVTEYPLESREALETVMSLVQQKPDDIVKVGIDADELAVTKAESKATYGEIQTRVKEQTGLNVTPLYIAQVKRKHGIIERECYNKAKSESAKMLICPPDKEKAIEEALRFFGMIA